MSDNFAEYINYARQVWRKRWLVLLVSAVVCTIGWPVVVTLPDRYTVSAKVYVDTQTILKPILKGLAVDSSDMTEQTALILQRTLLTRPNLEKVARATDLDLKAKTPAEFEGVLANLARKIDISVITNNRRGQDAQPIITISYSDSNPKMAKNVVEELLTIFVEGALGATRKDSTMSQEFLNRQIEEYEAKLVEAENRRKEFKQQNIGLMPADGSNYYSQINNETSRLTAAQLELDEAVKKRDELRRQIQAVIDATKSGGGDSSEAVALSPLDTRIENMKKKLDELLLQYTDEHPDVVSARRILADLEKQKAEEQKTTKPSRQKAQLLDKNPVYQELTVAMGEQEAQVAAMTVRVNLYKQNLDRLKKLVDTIPKVEAELAKLDRDYNVIHDNYLELVKRREAAKISFEAESKPDDLQFKVIDPPRIPLKPVWPNRLLLLSGVLAGGIGAGIALIVLMIQVRPTFYGRQNLQKMTNLPVFGAVSLIVSPAQVSKNRISVAMFVTAVVVLLFIYGGLVATQAMKINLTQFVQ